MESKTDCPKCRASTNSAARFCAQCGWDLSKPYSPVAFGAKGLLLTLAVGLVLWGSVTAIQSTRAGVKPTRPYQPDSTMPSEPSEPDPELDRLREQAKAQSGQLDPLRSLANALIERLRSAQESPPALVLEATDVLGQILRIDPKDPEALIALADISFNQKVFNKAVLLYQRYLELQPQDISARSRHASSLAFVGKTNEAVKELQIVLKTNPDNFHALAYLSITYAQMGDNAQALEIGKKALQHSPSAEATARFNEFLSALATKKDEAKVSTGLASKGPGGIAGLADYVAKNPVAGPKYVRFESASPAQLSLYFRQFPMEAMPPMAKDKFYMGIRTKAAELGLTALKKVIFLDADSGKELDTLAIEDQAAAKASSQAK